MNKRKLWIISVSVVVSVIIFGGIYQGSSQQTQDKDLVGYWKFDEGKGETVKDSSGNKNDGSVEAQWVSGKFGSALFFDGGPSVVVVPDNTLLQFGKSDFTIEFWINPDTLDIESEHKRRRVISKGDWPQTWWNIDILTSGQIQMEMADNNKGYGATVSDGKISAKKWTYLVVTVDRKNLKTKYYLNGKLDSTKDIPASFTDELNVEGKDLSIGGDWQQFTGLLDEVKIYKRLLSEDEIKSNYEKK